MLNTSNILFLYYLIKDCDDMKLCEKYGLAIRLQEISNWLF